MKRDRSREREREEGRDGRGFIHYLHFLALSNAYFMYGFLLVLKNNSCQRHGYKNGFDESNFSEVKKKDEYPDLKHQRR